MTQYVIVLVGRKVPPVFEVCGVNHVLGMDLFEDGAQGRSLPAIPGLRDTGVSLHNGIEPPTRGFSIRMFRFYPIEI